MSASMLSRSVAGIAICMAGGSGASAETAWNLRHGNGQIWVEAASISHGSTITVSCDDANRSIALNLYPPASWNGDAGYMMKVLIDGKPFAVVVDGIDNGVVLSNLPKEAIGIDRSLRRAMKSGKLMVVEGPPAAGIQAKQRSFALDGADAAISRIEAACPGVR